MKISIKYDPNVTETEVAITCRELTGEVREMISAVTLADNTITGTLGDETYFIPLGDILYFESVDRKVFFYTSEQTYETMSKMYAIEERLADTYFARVAKSFISRLYYLWSDLSLGGICILDYLRCHSKEKDQTDQRKAERI